MDGIDDSIFVTSCICITLMFLGIIYIFMTSSAKPFLEENHRKKVRVPLIEKEELSHDTFRFKFGLPTKSTVLGLPIGHCIKFFAPNVTGVKAGEWNGRQDREDGTEIIERKYTPTSSDRMKGSFDMVIKVYEGGKIPQFPDGGKFSQHLGRMKIGESIEISGPWGPITYLGNGIFKHNSKMLQKKKIGMLAGGTGITPMLQVVSAVLENPNDPTVCSLIYANKTEDDILVRDMLDKCAAEYPDRFTVHYTLDNPPSGWKGSKGFITQEMIEEHLPAPGSDSVVIMCGPPPMIKFACKENLDKIGFPKADQLEF